MKRTIKECGGLLGWRQVFGMLLTDGDGQFTARCPTCGRETKYRRATAGLKCKARAR